VPARDVHPSEMPHDPLDAFLDDLRSAAADTPSPAVGDELAALFRDGTRPVVSPTPAPRRRWSARAAVAGAVAGLAFGGLGIAGALPGPVQRGVADVARQVGVSLPDDDEPTTTTVTVPAPTTRVVPTPTTAPERSGDDAPGRSADRRQGPKDDDDEPRHSDGGDEAPATTPSDDHGDEDSSNRDSDDGEDSGSSDDDETDDSSASGPGGGSQAADRDNDSEGRSQ
jgi:hypothetical protein